MPSSSSTYSRFFRRLKDALIHALGERAPRIDDTSAESVMVLSLDSDVAGFTIVNGHAPESYRSSYDEFRKLYNRNARVWAQRNLCFVVLRSKADEADDEFFNHQQYDVYFCKKYVLRFPDDDDELREELVQLPFVPLPKGEAGGINRPVSAQSLLQDCGLSARLATGVVVPRKVGPDKIIELATKEGTSDLARPTGKFRRPTPETEKKVRNTRLTSVIVRDFRAFREQTFDLSADVTILYGQNGLGKTSLFDAIDFGCTGKIGRLCRHKFHASHFEKLARHLDSNNSDAGVELELQVDGRPVKTRRRVADWAHATWDHESRVSRPSLLQRLTNARWLDAVPRIENIETLFRASHLFGQHDQDFMLDFDTSSALNEEVVTRMLALDDFAQGRSKVHDVLEKISFRRDAAAQSMKDKETAAKEVDSELSQLSVEETHSDPSPSLHSEAKKLHVQLRSIIDADDLEQPVTAEVVRDWRSRLSATRDELRTALDRIRKMEDKAVQIQPARESSHENATKISELEESVARTITEINASNERIERLGTSERELKRGVDDAKSTQARIREAQRLAPQLSTAEKQVAAQEARLSTLRNELTQIDKDTAKHRAELKARQAGVPKLEGQESAAQQPVRQAGQLVDGVQEWRQNRDALSKLSDDLKREEAQRAALERERGEAVKNRGELQKRFAEINQRYERINGSADEITIFLETAEKLASESTCPACGIKHASRDDLILRIRDRGDQRTSDQKAVAAERIAAEKELESARSIVKEHQSKIENAQRRIDELRERSRELVDAIQAYERSAALLEIELRKRDAVASISRRHDALGEIANRLSRDLLAARQGVSEAEGQLEQTAATSRTNRLDRQTAESELHDLRVHRDKTKNELAELGTIADQVLEQGPRRLEALEREITQAARQLAEMGQERTQASAAATGRAQALERFRKDIANLKQRQEAMVSRIGQFDDRLETLGLPRAASPDMIEKRRRAEEERLGTTDGLLSRVRFVETALDAAALSARVDSLGHQYEILNKEIGRLQAEESHLAELARLFEQIETVLKDASGRTIRSYIKAFGPLATVIQHRLRAVYGFEDIYLKAEGGAIQVRVTRRSKTLKPSEYFSDSQVQILMLSLFLAGRLTQTWSGFAPTLLDDPVTHFDDLNAYAFAELIRGIVERSPNQHQFIISTCEERLFQILKTKLAEIKGGFRAYRFRSIGKNGPVVEQLD